MGRAQPVGPSKLNDAEQAIYDSEISRGASDADAMQSARLWGQNTWDQTHTLDGSFAADAGRALRSISDMTARDSRAVYDAGGSVSDYTYATANPHQTVNVGGVDYIVNGLYPRRNPVTGENDLGFYDEQGDFHDKIIVTGHREANAPDLTAANDLMTQLIASNTRWNKQHDVAASIQWTLSPDNHGYINPGPQPGYRDQALNWLREAAGRNVVGRTGIGALDGYLHTPEMLGGLVKNTVGALTSFPNEVYNKGIGQASLDRWTGMVSGAQNAFHEIDTDPEARGQLLFNLASGKLFGYGLKAASVMNLARGESLMSGAASIANDAEAITGGIATAEQPLLLTYTPTTDTLSQIRRMPFPERWQAGERYVQELYGSAGQEHFGVPAGAFDGEEIFGTGGRFVDSPVPTENGGVLAGEVKMYQQWRTVGGTPTQQFVPLSDGIQQQVLKDAWLRNNVSGYDPRWIFLDAPPSPALVNYLNNKNIVYVIHH